MKEESSAISLVYIQDADSLLLKDAVQFPLYSTIFVKSGAGVYHADFGAFPFEGPAILFSTPYQTIFLESGHPLPLTLLQFHGDFYCIEYHQAEVACNGLLFNNVYIEPRIVLTGDQAQMFDALLKEIKNELSSPGANGFVLKTYLQLFLAKSSAIKLSAVAEHTDQPRLDDLMEKFKELIDEHYLKLRRPSDYAKLLMVSTGTLHKRSTKYFKKSPSGLIHERLILEAKKSLHLTRASIKEIAYQLNFNDEFYFSRFFKKYTRQSPQSFREKTGISVVADLGR